MDTHDPNLTDLERRLASWRPSATGLDPDAMLFAAGRAAAGRPRPIWPALAGTMAVIAVVLAGWLASEHNERLVLARQLDSRFHEPVPVVGSLIAQSDAPKDLPADESLPVYRAMDQDVDAHTSVASTAYSNQPQEANAPAILRAGQRDVILNP
jgi:hypothetical protein